MPLRWYDRAVEAFDAMPPDDAALPMVETTLSRAEAAVQLGHLEAARADYERALAAARDDGRRAAGSGSRVGC